METIVELGIEGMTCQGCAAGIRKALRQLAGFGAAEIWVEEGRARVTFDASTCTIEQIEGAIEDAGFDIRR